MTVYNPKSWQVLFRVIEKILVKIDLSPYSPFYNPSSLPTTPFDNEKLPNSSLQNCLMRIYEEMKCLDSCFVIAFMYIDRMLDYNPGFVLSRLNANRLIISSLILSIKYVDDTRSDITLLSSITGEQISKLNELKSKMAELLRYNLYIDPNVYSQYSNEFLRQWRQIEQEDANLLNYIVPSREAIFSLMTLNESIDKSFTELTEEGGINNLYGHKSN